MIDRARKEYIVLKKLQLINIRSIHLESYPWLEVHEIYAVIYSKQEKTSYYSSMLSKLEYLWRHVFEGE